MEHTPHNAGKSNETKHLPEIEFLRECFDYEPESGILRWKKRPDHHFTTPARAARWNRDWAGKECGCKSPLAGGRKNYMQVSISSAGQPRSLVQAHRIALALMGVEINSGMLVDHVNGDPWDNRFENLRLATASQNSINCAKHRDRRSDLPKGVFKNKRGGGYAARLTLGTFRTPELANEAVCKAYRLYHGEFAKVD